jgi:ABC-type transporter Mla subunit MlaD
MARSKRNEFVAGLFILLAMALLVAIFVAISNWESLAVDKTVYHVSFDQAPAIKVGSPVRLGGSDIGRIVAIDLRWRHDPEQPKDAKRFYYVVAIKVPSEVQLRKDARISIESSVVGEDGWINIQNVGSGELAANTAEAPIVGSAFSVADVMDKLNDVAAQLSGVKTTGPIAETLINVRDVTADIKRLTPKVDQAVSDVVAVTGSLKTSVPELAADAKASLATMKSATAEIEAMLKENREPIKTGVAEATAAVAEARKKLAEMMDNLIVTTGDFRTLVAANRQNISDMVLDLRTTGEQLKAASIEIRRAPWRLLHKPDERQADTLNLFDATANYARSVQDLRSISETLQTLAKLKAEGAPVDEKLLQDMVDRLKVGFQKYDEAEAALWKQWGLAEQK